jgi:hypothetical protein
VSHPWQVLEWLDLAAQTDSVRHEHRCALDHLDGRDRRHHIAGQVQRSVIKNRENMILILATATLPDIDL